MKKLVFIWSILLSSISFSQVITVTWDSTKAYKFNGNTAKIPEFAAAGTMVFNAVGKGKKELDLKNMESRFYENNQLRNTLKIKSYTKTSKRIEIILLDYDLRTGLQFETYQTIDLKKNKSYYSWYYDGVDDVTWVYIEAGGKIIVK
jgi:hypothetical protein